MRLPSQNAASVSALRESVAKPERGGSELSQQRVKGDVMHVLYREQTLGILIQGQWKIFMQTEGTERRAILTVVIQIPGVKRLLDLPQRQGGGITRDTTPENNHTLQRTSQQVLKINPRSPWRRC
ncbi:hypothetical protein DPX16_3373 [Anabarilius grahami]|uniref:Uncharacterized protein n=1 Tax=Anabarilius grahami TaxID=495550 RepID=A0A3N0XP34_ANAGA|nr:hypothetical protein DPX16_3373 [Anabarilius grahami]